MDRPIESGWEEVPDDLLDAASTPVLRSYAVFCTESDRLADQLAEIAALMSEVSVGRLEFERQRAEELGELFASFARELLVGANPDDVIEELVGVYMRDNTNRIEMMEKMVSIDADVSFPKNNVESIRELFEMLLQEMSDVQSVCAVLGHMFADDLLSDVQRFFEGLSIKQSILHPDDLPQLTLGQEPRGGALPVAELRRHVLDVGKIAVGVLLGRVLHEIVQRRRRPS